MYSKLFLDTNILVDIAAPNRPQHKEAAEMLSLGVRAGCEFVASLSSIKDAYFILERHYAPNEAAARRAARLLWSNMTMVELTTEIVGSAFESDEPDFEDAIVRISAEQAGCDAIVSRDAKAFTSSDLPRVEPKDIAFDR